MKPIIAILRVLPSLVLCAATLHAAPVITSVVESGGDGTVTAQWTGNSFTGISPLGAYTVPPFSVLAKCFVDRTHAYTNSSGTALIPPYLIGNPYIMTRNDNRDNTGFRLDVTVSQDVIVYLLIDNRIGDATASATDPPFAGAAVTSWASMTWVGANGFRPVQNGLNRTSNTGRPDEVGIDESADGSINNWYSVYSNRYPAGTFSLLQQGLSGNNMYGVVVVGVGATAPPPAPGNVAAVSTDNQVVVSWSAAPTATGYNVKRSSTSGGPYTTLGSIGTTTSFTDSNVLNGNTYYYVVSGTNSVGEGTNSLEVIGRPNPVVSGIVAIGGTNQVTLSWSALANAQSYSVLRAGSSGGPFTEIVSGLVAPSYLDLGLNSGSTYYYRVAANLGAAGTSGQSALVSAVTAPSVPAVTGAQVFATTIIAVNWATNDAVVPQITIERSTDGATFVPVGSAAATARVFYNSNLTLNTTYFYRLQATNASGLSAYSSVVSNTTPTGGFDINFATGGNNSNGDPIAPIPPGYLQDIGEYFGDRTNGFFYGWTNAAGTNITRDARYRRSASSPDLRFDTFTHMQKGGADQVWEMQVPNGFYRVRVVGGDPSNVDSVFQWNVEGVLTPTYTPVSGAWWGDFTVNVAVSDGKLTVRSGPSASNGKIDFLQIYQDIPVAPVIGTQPQSTTLEQNRPLTLSFTLTSGSTPLAYQWYKGDAAVQDATNSTYSVPHVQSGDAGTYFVVITNYGGAATSQVASVSVTPDTVPPVVVSVGSLDGRTIGVLYNEEMDVQPFAPATDPFYYFVTQGGNQVEVSSVIVQPNHRAVQLVLGQQISGAFSVEINSVADLAGNVQSSTATNGVVAGFLTGDIGAPGFPGSNFTADNNVVTIVGGGADYWGNSDQAYIATKSITGDFDARIRVNSVLGANAVTKTVLLARESTNAESAGVHLSVNPPPPGRNQIEMGLRPASSNATVAVGSSFVPAGVPNAWMRLTRAGNVFTGYRSTNGVDWVMLGQTNSPMASTLAVGFGVTAHDNTLLATGTVSNFTIDQVFPDLSVGVSASPEPATTGGTLTYTIGVTNLGTVPAPASTITDVLPAGLTLVSATSSQGSCTNTGGTVTCSLGTIPPGFVVSATIVVTPTVARVVTNTVSAATSALDPVSVNNSASVVSTINAGVNQQPIVNVQYSNGTFAGAIQTQNGVTYQVQYKNEVTDATWTLLTTISGDGTVKPFSDPNATVPHRFYRIIIQ